MLITSGHAKGHFLHEPRLKGLNPAHSLLRKKLFDTIQDRLVGKRILDLFAGTGAFGFEALSRGAISVDFVDNSAESVRSLNKNAHHSRFLGRYRIFHKSVMSFLAGCLDKYDVIIIDPPTSYGNYFELFDMLKRSVNPNNLIILRNDGFIIHHPRVTVISEIKHGREKVLLLTINTKQIPI